LQTSNVHEPLNEIDLHVEGVALQLDKGSYQIQLTELKILSSYKSSCDLIIDTGERNTHTRVGDTFPEALIAATNV